MPILCEPASSAGELIHSIGGEVHAADTLGAAAKLLDSDPNEILVVIGPRVADRRRAGVQRGAAAGPARGGRDPGPQGRGCHAADPGAAVRRA